MIPYFSGALRVGKAVLVFLDARFRKDDSRRGVAGGVLFRGWGCLLFLKSGIVYPGSKAFARMTIGGVSQAVCFFAGGDVSCF